MMQGLDLTPLYEALAELELAAALVLLAEQESQSIPATLPRLRDALAAVHEARALAAELAGATGRPTLERHQRRERDESRDLRCGVADGTGCRAQRSSFLTARRGRR